MRRKKRYTVLLVDSANHRYEKRLSCLNKECCFVHKRNQRSARSFIVNHGADLVLLGCATAESCVKILKVLKSEKPLVPVIIIAEKGSEELAVSAFRRGAKDYFRKPVDMDEFIASIRNALGLRRPVENRSVEGLNRAYDCIHQYYNTQIRLKNIARVAGMSESCFERKFKQEFGEPFSVYLNKYRIAKAIDMLREDGHSMSDIAFACGFTNQFHFTRTFKKVTAKSPLQYRKSLKR